MSKIYNYLYWILSEVILMPHMTISYDHYCHVVVIGIAKRNMLFQLKYWRRLYGICVVE